VLPSPSPNPLRIANTGDQSLSRWLVMPTQVNWRFRQLCNAMFYDGLPSKFAGAGAGPPLGFHVGHRAGLIQAVDAARDRG
jgi:hypothetical protein